MIDVLLQHPNHMVDKATLNQILPRKNLLAWSIVPTLFRIEAFNFHRLSIR